MNPITMNDTKKRIAALIAISAIGAAGSGAAFAAAQSSDSAPAPAAQPLNSQVAATVSVLRSSHDAVPGNLVKEIAGAPAGSALASVDFARAHAFRISGAGSSGWIAPSGDSVCTFVPDPAGAYGATCVTAGQVTAGQSTTVLAGGPGLPEGKSIIVQIVSDGAAPPRIISTSGTVTSLPVTANVAAELRPSGGVLEAGSTKLPLPVPPTTFTTPKQ